MTFTHMDGLKSLDTPGKFGHIWKHWKLEPWNLLWILPDNSYGFFQTTLMDSSRQLLWILSDPLDLHEPWPNCNPGCAVKRTLSFWTLLCGEDNGTQTYAAGMDRRHHDGVCIRWSHQEPYGQWVNQPVPTPTPSITIDNTFGVPMVWC